MRQLAILLGALAMACLPNSVLAADNGAGDEAENRAVVEKYLHLHNTHKLNQTMEMYHTDAVFLLNGGRPPVNGRAAIRELERFDIYAKSTVQPYGLTFERRGSAWAVHLAGVTEHSDIFAAIGLVIVQTEPTRDAFIIERGLIRLITQPEVKAACRTGIIAGFVGMTKWLIDTNDARAPDLINDGKLKLVPGTIRLVVQAIKDWRAATGWEPDPATVRLCATA